MKVVLIVFIIYIVLLLVSLLGPYIEFMKEFRKKEPGKRYTLGDVCDATMEDYYVVVCFIPVANIISALASLGYLLSIIWRLMRKIRVA